MAKRGEENAFNTSLFIVELYLAMTWRCDHLCHLPLLFWIHRKVQRDEISHVNNTTMYYVLVLHICIL